MCYYIIDTFICLKYSKRVYLPQPYKKTCILAILSTNKILLMTIFSSIYLKSISNSFKFLYSINNLNTTDLENVTLTIVNIYISNLENVIFFCYQI